MLFVITGFRKTNRYESIEVDNFDKEFKNKKENLQDL